MEEEGGPMCAACNIEPQDPSNCLIDILGEVNLRLYRKGL